MASNPNLSTVISGIVSALSSLYDVTYTIKTDYITKAQEAMSGAVNYSLNGLSTNTSGVSTWGSDLASLDQDLSALLSSMQL